jgi:hypothetical protein
VEVPFGIRRIVDYVVSLSAKNGFKANALKAIAQRFNDGSAISPQLNLPELVSAHYQHLR